MRATDGTGLFEVIVRRVDGDVHSGKDHITQVRSGSWVAALRDALGATNSFRYERLKASKAMSADPAENDNEERFAELTRRAHAQGLPWGRSFHGPDPVTMYRMSRAVLNNITVHLANEHRVSPDKIPHEQRHWRHALAHLYGEFRPGQEHYHDKKVTPEG